MSMTATLSPSRRTFLKAASGTALIIGFELRLGMVGKAEAATGFAPNAFLRIAPDNSVTVLCKHLEMGQGTYTGLATIVAEELDADWAQITAEGAPADAKLYANFAFGTIQGTGGSTAMANSWDQMRQAGASARAMLVTAAAKQWGVPESEISVQKGVVSHAKSQRQARFGALCTEAAKLPVPTSVTLKDAKNFTLIGTRLSRLDSPAKTDGSAQFAIDVKLPGMVTALIARPPRFGATLRSVDDSAAKAIAGLVEIVSVPQGVAVIGRDFWSARQARDALKIDWDESQSETRGSPELLAEYRRLADTPGALFRNDGDAPTALAGAAQRISAEFTFPYLAHAPMEPLSCVIQLTDGAAEIWAGDQFQTIDQQNAAAVLGIAPDKVRINTLYAGGSFGRRANTVSDYVVEAASIAKAAKTKAPIRLLWTREDDVTGGRYRPMFLHRMEAGIDADGHPVAWQHRLVGQSILTGTPFEKFMVKDGIDEVSVEGVSDLPYSIANFRGELHSTKVGVPVLWWRSVGHSHTGYATEVFLDRIAAAAKQDPVALRRALLATSPRHLGVLNLAVEKAGGSVGKLGPNRGRGVAMHKAFDTYVAQVADVTVGADGTITVERVVCAVDCGIAINPDVIVAQMEGAIGFGLGAALYGEITLDQGKIEQSNFDRYQVLRMAAMPKIEVHIVPSSEKPTGVGEPGVPPIAPAIANAVLAATGIELSHLPLTPAAVQAARKA